MGTVAEGPGFPKLNPTNHSQTSEFDFGYNCIAWAAGDTRRFWWPQPETGYVYWPPGVCRQVTRQCFIDAFATLGYLPATALDISLEEGIEKIALFEDDAGTPTHAARQLPSGAWTSKLGKNIDIEHADAEGVEGPAYGRLVLILVRSALQHAL